MEEEKKIEFMKRVREGNVTFDGLDDENDVLIDQCLDDNLMMESKEGYTPTEKGSRYLDRKENKKIQEESLFWQKINGSLSLGKAIGGAIIFLLGVLTGGLI